MGKKLYRKGDLLSITVTLDPSLQKLNKPYLDRLDATDAILKGIMTRWYRLGGIAYIQFHREITWYGLIHYHGVIKVECPKRLASAIADDKYSAKGRSLINIDLDSINDINVWMDYCEKDMEIMGGPITMGLIDGSLRDALLAVAVEVKKCIKCEIDIPHHKCKKSTGKKELNKE